MQEKENQEHQQLKEQLLREETKIKAMIQVGKSLNAIHNLDELLVMVVNRVTDLMEADRSTLFLLDQEKQEIWSKVAQGDNLREIRQSIGTGVAGWVVTNGMTLNLKDAYQDERFNPEIDHQTGYLTKSLLSAPLRGKQGNVMGVIQSLNKKKGWFNQDDEKLLEAISSQVSIAIENAQLVTKLVRKNLVLTQTQEKLAKKIEELEVLYELEKEISTSVKEQDLLHRLLKRAVELVGCEAGSIVLLSEETEDLYFASAVGKVGERVKHLRLPRGAGVAGWVAETGKSVVIDRPEQDPRHLMDIEVQLGFPVRNILSVPLAAGGEQLGAVELLNKKSGFFDRDDELLASLIAGQAVSAIQVAQRRAEHDKENRLSSIGQMLSGLIHDFRTPMTIISGYVQIMAMEDSENQRKQQSKLVMRQFDFINDMTKELMAFARGDSKLLLRPVYLDKLLGEMDEILRRELEPEKIDLKVENRYTGKFRADETKLRRLIFNITRNARQAMSGGGEFTITVDEEADWVRLAFSDTGPGIAEELRSRLFESFFTSGKPGGTGLGLAVVKKIVDEHRGKIKVDSSPHGGARFVVWMPKRPEA